MKIGIISDYFYPLLGGITEHIYNFSKYAIKAGHEVKVITPAPFNCSKAQLIEIDETLLPGSVIRCGHHLPVFSNGSLSSVGIMWNLGGKLKKIFETEKFDVIHSHSVLAGVIPMLSIKYSNTLTIGTMHTYFNGNYWFEKFKKTLIMYYDELDGCISVSESSRDVMQKYLGRSPVVIPNGIDTNVFGGTVTKLKEFDDGKVNVFFIGRAEIRNGIDVLIKAFLKAIKEYGNMRLIIAGDGPYLSYFSSLVPDEHRKDIHFVGKILHERPEYYNTCDIHVFPAEIAAHSITVLEGLASGKPIITTDIKSFRDVITEGQEGFLVKYGDVDTMARRIVSLAKDKSLREKMGRLSRQKAMEYSWEKVTERIIAFYRECHKKALGKYPLI